MSEKKIIVTMKTRKPKPVYCDVCGKEVPIGRMMCGGPFRALCKNCDKIAIKVIKAYIKMISRNPLYWLAKTIVKEEEKRRIQK